MTLRAQSNLVTHMFPYRIKTSKSSSQELSLCDKGGFIKNYLTMFIMEAMQWYNLRGKGFNRQANVLRKKKISSGAKKNEEVPTLQ